MAIKVYRSDHAGAPEISGVAGALINVLDAVLVNGYGNLSVNSIIRSGGTVTVETATAHDYQNGDSITVSGANEADYNGEFLVTAVDSTHFTYSISTEPSSPATGTLACRRAPAGFTKVFDATQKAVYRSSDVSGLQHYYRVIDDGLTSGGSREGRIRGYVTMADIDMGDDPYPTLAQYPNGGFFVPKSDQSNSDLRQWVIITDGKTVYYFPYYGYAPSNTPLFQITSYTGGVGFGDIIAFKPGDAYAAFCAGGYRPNQLSSYNYSTLFNTSDGSFNSYDLAEGQRSFALARNYNAIPGAVPGCTYGAGFSSDCLGASSYITYPNPVDNGFYMAPVIIGQRSGSDWIVRGRMPGIYDSLHGRCFPNTQVIDNVQGYAGRRFMMLYVSSYSTQGCVLVDITGPWDD